MESGKVRVCPVRLEEEWKDSAMLGCKTNYLDNFPRIVLVFALEPAHDWVVDSICLQKSTHTHTCTKPQRTSAADHHMMSNLCARIPPTFAAALKLCLDAMPLACVATLAPAVQLEN